MLPRCVVSRQLLHIASTERLTSTVKAYKTIALLLGFVFSLAACQSSSPNPAAEMSDNGAVTFTHPVIPDLTIEFDKKPTTIVTDYYTAAALSVYGIKPAGVFGFSKDESFIKDNVDLDGVPEVGQGGEINLEKLAEIKPDVIIGYGKKDGWSWFKPDVNAKMVKVAPFIPFDFNSQGIDENFKQARAIAEFLGGDVTSEEVKKADEKWETAKEDLKKAAEGKNLSILLTSPLKETVYTAVGFSQSKLFEDAGITVIGPDKPKEGNPWGQVSWEELPNYPADIYAYERNSEINYLESPFWKDSKAVKADQVFEWNARMPYSSQAYGNWLAEVAQKIATFQKLP